MVELPAAGGHHDVRSSRGRERLPVDIGVVEKVHVLDDDALFGGRLAGEHLRAIGNTGVLLSRDRIRDAVVTGARRDVVAVGPDRWTWVIGKERPQKLV